MRGAVIALFLQTLRLSTLSCGEMTPQKCSQSKFVCRFCCQGKCGNVKYLKSRYPSCFFATCRSQLSNWHPRSTILRLPGNRFSKTCCYSRFCKLGALAVVHIVLKVRNGSPLESGASVNLVFLGFFNPRFGSDMASVGVRSLAADGATQKFEMGFTRLPAVTGANMLIPCVGFDSERFRRSR